MGISKAGHAEYGDPAEVQVVTALGCSLVGKSIEVHLEKGSRLREIYRRETAVEKTTCSYGFNPACEEAFHHGGFRVAGRDSTGEPRAMELQGHPFFIVTLYQPQLTSSPGAAHPVFHAFLSAAARRG